MEGGRAAALLVLAILVAVGSGHVVEEQHAAEWENIRLFAGKYDAPDYKYRIPTNPGSNTFCTLANMDFSFLVSKPKGTGDSEEPLPKTITVKGSCGELTSSITLQWDIKVDKEKDKPENLKNSITFNLYRNETHFFVHEIVADVYLNLETTGNPVYSRMTITKSSLRSFMAAVNSGVYKCSNEVLPLNNVLKLKFTDISLIAFNTEEDYSKRTANQCTENDDKPGVPSSATSSTTSPTTSTSPSPSTSDYIYVVKDATGTVCTLANMTISMKIKYNKGANETTVDVPKSGMTVTGSCNKDAPTIEITWKQEPKPTKAESESNSTKLTFAKDDASYYLKDIEAKIFFADAEGQSETYHMGNLTLFKTPEANLYKCAPETSEQIEGFTVTITEVVLIPFNNGMDVTKKTEENCEYSNVGAIVGGIIGALAAVALIAFIIVMWRKRSR